MDLLLYEKLKGVDEVVATEDPQKLMSDYYEEVGTTSLVLLPLTSTTGQYKFWLLSNGQLLPIKNTHEEAALVVGTNWRKLLQAGAIRGTVIKKGEMNLQSEKKPSRQQRAVLRQLYIDYRVDSVWMDAAEHVGGKLTSWHIEPKSVKELDYYLTYGKGDFDESKLSELIEEVYV